MQTNDTEIRKNGRLHNKVAIIVGAGQTPGETIGNGRATALLFAREGARLLLVDRDPDSVEETRQMIVAEGGQAITFTADITKSEQCAAFVEACMAEYGRIDILHNNVGIMRGDNHAIHLTEEVWDMIMDVNLKGMFLSIKHVLPIMKAQSSGVITNISSTSAVWSGVPFIAYNTSKAGVNGLTTALVVKCASYGVRVNAIMPGLMETPMAVDEPATTKSVSRDEVAAKRNAAVPLGGKQGSAWDVAYAALFLASDEAKFITGAILPVDGGLLLRRG